MSNRIKILSHEDVKKCIDMSSAIDAMRIAFSELSAGRITSPIRTNIPLGSKSSNALFMPVFFPAKRLVGLKTVMVHKDNPSKHLPMIQSTYNVFDAETGETIAIMDGEYLTSMRTGAASGLATDLLAVEDTKIAVIFGAGVQAEKQIEAICEVRKFEKIYISDLNPKRIEKLINSVKDHINCEFAELKDQKLLSEAEVICTATSSSNTVFDHALLKDKVHINGIGSYRADMAEIPPATIISSKLYVDSREACLNEAGDILNPLKKGEIYENHIFAEIGEVAIKMKLGREEKDNITVFKSVGTAAQDIAAASLILDNAEKLNIGNEINL